MKYYKGAFDPISIAFIVVCFAIGGYFYFKSDTIDAPLEQVAEKVLREEGIDIDFSADKKAKRDSSAKK